MLELLSCVVAIIEFAAAVVTLYAFVESRIEKYKQRKK